MASKYYLMAVAFRRNGQLPACRTAINRALARSPIGSVVEKKVKQFMEELKELDKFYYM